MKVLIFINLFGFLLSLGCTSPKKLNRTKEQESTEQRVGADEDRGPSTSPKGQPSPGQPHKPDSTEQRVGADEDTEPSTSPQSQPSPKQPLKPASTEQRVGADEEAEPSTSPQGQASASQPQKPESDPFDKLYLHNIKQRTIDISEEKIEEVRREFKKTAAGKLTFVAREVLNNPELLPVIKITVQDQSFFLSNIKVTSDSGRYLEAVLFHSAPNQPLSAHLLYRSRSAGGWRIAPIGYSSGKYSKGGSNEKISVHTKNSIEEGFVSHHYTQEAKPIPEIANAIVLLSMESTVESLTSNYEKLKIVNDAIAERKRITLEDYFNIITTYAYKDYRGFTVYFPKGSEKKKEDTMLLVRKSIHAYFLFESFYFKFLQSLAFFAGNKQPNLKIAKLPPYEELIKVEKATEVLEQFQLLPPGSMCSQYWKKFKEEEGKLFQEDMEREGSEFDTFKIKEDALKAVSGFLPSNVAKNIIYEHAGISEFLPNFNFGLLEKFKIGHTLLCDDKNPKCIKINVFGGILNGRLVHWHFAVSPQGYIWIDRLHFADSLVSPLGIFREVLDSGVLTNKPLDYIEQVDCLNKEYRVHKSPYALIINFIGLLKPVQDYGAWVKKNRLRKGPN